MRRTFTLLFTVIGAVLCLIHYFGHDHEAFYLLFYALSIPAWVAPIFINVNEISMNAMFVIYMLTIASWAFIGYVIDRVAMTIQSRRSSDVS
jgi:hypothetical protein